MNDHPESPREQPLPKWLHEVDVHADEIVKAGTAAELPGRSLLTAARARCRCWELKSGRIVHETAELTERGEPAIGDFFVIEPDGRERFMARAKFLETHRPAAR